MQLKKLKSWHFFRQKNAALVKRVYDINPNYLGVSPQESGGLKEEETVVEEESFLFMLLSRQDIIPLFTNAKNAKTNIIQCFDI
ncbi:hypothetical protein [Okeania sp. KiyG1]|uniref:hypothetical protein n=1 Tax=Okeania sp. KiyG1 TaxID=2720165 RepID=UPI0019228656|nr:hypothetical protein [Okeania sp. KiyG1]GFZ90415.1 hypothetical protein CYANOKiyG1_00730 [Okeania sp. KiyG1]